MNLKLSTVYKQDYFCVLSKKLKTSDKRLEYGLHHFEDLKLNVMIQNLFL